MLSIFRNLPIGSRLVFSFGGAIALLVALSLFTMFELSKVRGVAAEVSGPQAERLSLAEEWRMNIVVNAQRTLALVTTTDSQQTKSFEAEIKRTSARTSEVQKRFGELETTAEGLAALGRMAEFRKNYLAQRDLLMQARVGGDAARTQEAAERFKPMITAYNDVASELVAFETQRHKALSAEVVDTVDFTGMAILVAAAAGVLSAGLFGFVMYRSTVPPLKAARDVADRIAGGDLGTRIDATGRDEIGLLMLALAEMQESFRTLVGGIRRSADSIGVASVEVASGNQDLSSRTEQAAASLQKTASSVEQITSTVRHSAESAKQADELARAASAVAAKGGEAVIEVGRTMEGIQSSSRRIADIIGTIDGIAFQTNILALNAAVEAARAGEQGRGFAVVATEVRNLAQRSASAAREIKTLIGDSVDRVEVGSAQALGAGQTIGELVASVKRVSDIVAEISAASAQQAHGIDEINEAVSHLDQATQQNAALVEQSAAAAESLKDQASTLAQSVQRFRLAA
ncbi:methyl-accepting chemotaxis protein [soil metagenome]